jgi:hypothetical protein
MWRAPLGGVAAGRAAVERSRRLSTGWFLALVCAVTVLVRLVYVWMPLRSDEAGYLFAARHWAPGAGEFVYGDYQVDRPPLLLGIYRVAALWESDAAIRVLAIPFVLVGVLALARAGFLLAGESGARWAAVVGAALISSPALAGDQADGELFAAVFVAGSVAAALQAWQAPTPTLLARYGVLAGALAAAAMLVKQNFLDGFVFVFVFLLVHGLRQRGLSARALALAGSSVLGALVAGAAVVGWVLWHGIDPGRMWVDIVEFRGDALGVILRGNLEAPATRAFTMLLLAVVSAAVPIGWVWARWVRSGQAPDAPEHRALTAMLVYAVASMAAGGSYWPHYLLQAVTPVALVAAVVAVTSGRHGRVMRRWAQVAAASAVVCWVAMTVVYALVPYVWFTERIGHWLGDSAARTDTVFVAYGHPHVLESADLASPYPYLWSLPMRAHDPHQERLREVVEGAEAPDWIVQINGLNSWGIDSGGQLRDLVDDRYEHVADVCGSAVHLRVGLTRELAPLPDC